MVKWYRPQEKEEIGEEKNVGKSQRKKLSIS